MTNHRIMRVELQMMSRSCTEDRLILGQRSRANSNSGGTINQSGISQEKRLEERQHSVGKTECDRRNFGLKVHSRRRRRGIREGGINSSGRESSKAIGDNYWRRRRSRTNRTRRLGKNKRRISSQRNLTPRRLEVHDERGEPAGRGRMTGERKTLRRRELKKTVKGTLPREGNTILGGMKESRKTRKRRITIITKIELTRRVSRIIGKTGESESSSDKRKRKRMGGRLRTVISPNNGHGVGKERQEGRRPPPGKVTARSEEERGLVKSKNKKILPEEAPTFSRRSATRKAVARKEAAAHTGSLSAGYAGTKNEVSTLKIHRKRL